MAHSVDADDETVASQGDPFCQQVGVIELQIRLVIFDTHASFTRERDRLPEHVLQRRVIHEQDKKRGAGHQVVLGDEYRIKERPPKFIKRQRLDPSDPSPFVIFKYHYRPRDVLIADRIIPRVSVNPQQQLVEIVELSSDDEIVDITNEVLAKRRRVAELQREIMLIKSELTSRGADTVVQVKREDDHNARRRRHGRGREVIDLT